MTAPESTDELQAGLHDGGRTVCLLMLAPFIRLLEEAGADVFERTAERAQARFARWGIELSELEPDPTLRLPYGLLMELHDELIEMLGDPSAPLRAGAKIRVGDYELLEYLCSTCGTLGESMACLGRYYPLLIDAEQYVHVDGDRAESRFRLPAGLAAPDSAHEFALASNFWMAIQHIKLEGAQMPIEVCFSHRAPAYVDLFPQIFLAPVRFEQEHNAIVFPTAMLDHPMATPDPALHAVLARLADAELAKLGDQSVFPSRVRSAIEVELQHGAALDAVAERLGMSASAVRSRLRQHGTSYSDLVERMRQEYAKRELRQSQLSIAEVGHRLGFAHPPAFHRAFRRWFGVTPSAYREAPAVHPTSRLLRKRS